AAGLRARGRSRHSIADLSRQGEVLMSRSWRVSFPRNSFGFGQNSERRVRRRRSVRLLVEQIEDRTVPALVINPTFDSSITSDPNAAKIEATINTAIQIMESYITNPVTVEIAFSKTGDPSVLGQSDVPG